VALQAKDVIGTESYTLKKLSYAKRAGQPFHHSFSGQAKQSY
jgi:hypothetical protein